MYKLILISIFIVRSHIWIMKTKRRILGIERRTGAISLSNSDLFYIKSSERVYLNSDIVLIFAVICLFHLYKIEPGMAIAMKNSYKCTNV